MLKTLLCFIVLSSGCGEDQQQGERKEGEYQRIKLVMTVNGTNIATDTKVANKFAELIAEETNGNIVIDVFPNDQPTGGKYYEKILATQGITYLASAHNGFRQVTNGNTAIQQGTIDGQENGFSVTNSAKVNEIRQYMTVWNYTYENYLFVANTEIFESLEPKTQELIRAKAKEACEWGRDLVENDEENLKEKFIKGGMELTVLTPEQLKPFQDKVQGVRHELMEKYGPEACEAFQMH